MRKFKFEHKDILILRDIKLKGGMKVPSDDTLDVERIWLTIDPKFVMCHTCVDIAGKKAAQLINLVELTIGKPILEYEAEAPKPRDEQLETVPFENDSKPVRSNTNYTHAALNVMKSIDIMALVYKETGETIKLPKNKRQLIIKRALKLLE